MLGGKIALHSCKAEPGDLADLSGSAGFVTNAGAAQAAIAVGDLGEVLLVVVLCIIEGGGGGNLCGDLAKSRSFQASLKGGFAVFGGGKLAGIKCIDAGAVLGAHIVALAHALGRVVALPKDGQQVCVADDLGVKTTSTTSLWPVMPEQTSS